MNPKALFAKVKTILLAQTWNSGTNKVFHPGSVVISDAPDASYLNNCVSPMAIIRPGDSTSDDEEPDLITQRFSVRLVAVVPGDAVGENALMGANIASGHTSGATVTSDGRGVFDIETPLFGALTLLEQDEGVQIVSRAQSGGGSTLDENLGYIAWRDYQFEALVSSTSGNL